LYCVVSHMHAIMRWWMSASVQRSCMRTRCALYGPRTPAHRV
jgi:hypothetical protein